MITLIAAMNHFGTIGLNEGMPWHNKQELMHFKNYTMGKNVVMGRKTFEGLPKTLKGRNVYVVSRNPNFNNVVLNFDALLEKHMNDDEELIVAGGGEIYRKALPYARFLVLSYIHDNEVVGDTFFPSFSMNDFQIIHRKVYTSFTQITYKRKGDIVL